MVDGCLVVWAEVGFPLFKILDPSSQWSSACKDLTTVTVPLTIIHVLPRLVRYGCLMVDGCRGVPGVNVDGWLSK